MKKNNNTLDHRERVTSTYAEIYFDDDYCEYKKPTSEESVSKDLTPADKPTGQDEWVSPSDLLIGILALKPPFTSRITRGKTHEGILKIGNELLEKERARFMKYLTNLLYENDAAWTHILEHEKAVVTKKVKEIYQQIFDKKSKTMMEEMNIFYEHTLQEIEDHMRKEIETVFTSAHAKIVSDTNRQIKVKLRKEKIVLETRLNKRYLDEIKKIKHYYRLLLHNEVYRNKKLVNQAIYERNDALKAFYKQIDAENITSTMYVMSTERKKCRIKQFILENYQSIELAEKYQKIKERQHVIDDYKEKEKHIVEINKEWEEKIGKILQLFLKFLSFGLKMLPEQTSFLLDFERMVVLQLNEMQRTPQKVSSILIDEVKYVNMFQFEDNIKDVVCEKQPFVIEGDLLEPVPPYYGSRETLPSDVDLPTIRLERQFLYAKCHKFEEIIDLIKESEGCTCKDLTPSPAESACTCPIKGKQLPTANVIESVSSIESFLIDDIEILHECPVRNCKEWAKKFAFPFLDSYLDFTEDNYKKVKAIFGKPVKLDKAPEFLEGKSIARRELPFSVTKEPYHHVETQYSSQEDLYVPDIPCPCLEDNTIVPITESVSQQPVNSNKEFDKIVMKRRISLERLLRDKPNLLKMFTDESFDFIYHIK